MRKFITWGRSPILIPRWVLTLKYVMFVFVGVTVYVASSPSLDITTWEGYTPFWSIALIVASLTCIIGSASPRLEVMERWAVLVLFALLIGYAVAPVQLVLAGDTDRAAYSILAITLSLLPGARAAMLIHRTGRPHV
ncbi:hypothetical protein P5G50_18275 [Leifsonia sp. F6_8S_P_1B]|uniref:Uncharacterized protein n=1 Tax=Leifsonia williamsii TaxID=3035919 RepID=A0ABT8KG39_9MICO|nr:hypothetical protein [Leifsonia williamsii]MDN4616398.1 hypothetical protein [Leifsonia williamsii]